MSLSSLRLGWAQKKRWTLRRFPPAGRLVLVLYTLALPFVVDVRLTTIYQLFTFTIALMTVAVAWGLRQRPRVDIVRTLPALVVAGEPFIYAVELRAPEAAVHNLIYMEDPAWPDARCEPPCAAAARRPWAALPRPLADIPDVPVPPIPAGGMQRIEVRATPLQRGVLAWEGATLAVPDPLGLFHGLVQVKVRDSVVVLPRRYRVPPLALPARRTHQPRGLRQALSVGDSQEFAGLREYRPGDPLRHIHWPSLAKLTTPVVREYHEEWICRQAVVLDTFPPRRQSATVFEDAVSVAASFVGALRRYEEGLLDLLFVEDGFHRFTAGRGLGRREAMLRALAGVQPAAEGDFPELADAVKHHAATLGGAALVLLDWDSPRQALVASLLQAGVALQVFVLEEDLEGGMDMAEVEQDVAAPASPGWLRRLRPGRVQEDLLS